MMKRCIPALAAIAALLCGAAAQAERPVVYGEYAQAPKAAVAARLRIGPAKDAAQAIELSPVADTQVDEVRRANIRNGLRHERRVVIGVTRSAAGDPVLADSSRWQWLAADGGRAARASVTSPSAGSLRLAVELAGVPDDVEMVFFGSADPARLEGPVRVGDIRDRSAAWWSPVTEGDTQTVEFFVPSRHEPQSLPLAISGASHIFSTPSSRFTQRTQEIGSAGSCNVDVACSSLIGSRAFQDIAASVAQMVFVDGRFTVLCSGSLLNDADPSTQVPWFYSADHCFDNETAPYKTPAQMQVVASTLATLWSFEAGACVNGVGSGTPVPTWSQLAGGATFVYNNPQSDVLFIRLVNAPPAGAFFSGWDPNPIAAGTAVITVHHPHGDLKKVTQGTVRGFSNPGVAGGSNTFIEILWSLGTTEPGSSGGGLWSFDGTQYLFRGGLWGGDALCTNMAGTDNFSRFDQGYGSLAAYLGSVGSAIDYTDLWWNPSESGWGLNLIQHPSNVIFGVWFTYREDRGRTWFVIPSGSWISTSVYTGPLYSTSGPSYNGPFDPALVTRTQVGSVTLSFSDANNGTFAYTVNGVAGSRAITRLLY
jgi:lysyl endopeptidase